MLYDVYSGAASFALGRSRSWVHARIKEGTIEPFREDERGWYLFGYQEFLRLAAMSHLRKAGVELWAVKDLWPQLDLDNTTGRVRTKKIRLDNLAIAVLSVDIAKIKREAMANMIMANRVQYPAPMEEEAAQQPTIH